MNAAKTLAALVDVIVCRPLLTRKDLARRYLCTIQTIDDWHRAGVLPPSVHLAGSRYTFWRPSDIHANEKTHKWKLRLESYADFKASHPGRRPD